ncbi:MAG: putative fucosyl transferase [Parachlamydiales bacterium]|nr:putative fucosyl transferase [Parachlamydiales bacterium]
MSHFSLSNNHGGGRTIFVCFPDEGDDLFFVPTCRRDDLAKPYIGIRKAIEKAGFKFKTTTDGSGLSDVAAILSITHISTPFLQNILKHSNSKCFLVIQEPPVFRPEVYNPHLKRFFRTMFTMFDNLVDNRTYFKFYHFQARDKMVENIPGFADKKFSVMLQSHLKSPYPNELYSERDKVAQFFANSDEFDLYGRLWEGTPNWRGYFNEDKITLIKDYKFCFCFENMKNQVGYITERIFEVMFSGSVPIYWGADNITDYVPKDCFIDRRDFSSYDDLYRFLNSIDQTRYEAYLTAIQNYLHSPQFEPFSSPDRFGKHIVDTMVSILQHQAHF